MNFPAIPLSVYVYVLSGLPGGSPSPTGHSLLAVDPQHLQKSTNTSARTRPQDSAHPTGLSLGMHKFSKVYVTGLCYWVLINDLDVRVCIGS